MEYVLQSVFHEPTNQTAMKTVLTIGLLLCITTIAAASQKVAPPTCASWYGEAHRGRLMANGKKFDPNQLTAASWFYPLGTKVRVTLNSGRGPAKSVIVTITDRGPAKELVRNGRKIDLSRAAFKRLADLNLGLIPVVIYP
jgi:rare lipoprotein A